MGKTRNYPNNKEKLMELAKKGDVIAGRVFKIILEADSSGEEWLLKKIEATELATAISKLQKADAEVIEDIAKILINDEKAKADVDNQKELTDTVRRVIQSRIAETIDVLKKVQNKTALILAE